MSFGINFINLLFPLLLIPFYIKTFGIDTYGLIAVSMAFINIVSVLYDYSWYAFAPVELQTIKGNFNLISRYISKIINCKIVIFLPSTILLLIFILCSEIKYNLVFSFSLLVFLFSRSQNNLCFFIGLDKVFPYFLINSIVKIGCIALILITLVKKNDYQFVFYYLGISDILIFIFSTLYLLKKIDFKYNISSIKEIYAELISGYKLFLTNLTICALMNSSTIILSIFFDNTIAGIYNVAEKIIMLCKQSISVLFQGVYFKACQIGTSKIKQLNAFLKSVFWSYFLMYSLGGLILMILPNLIISILSSEFTSSSSLYLIYMAPIPLIAALNQPAYMSLLLHHQKKNYFKAHLLGLIINIVLSFILCNFMNVYGIILSLVLTEIFITTSLNFAIIKNGELNFFKNIIN
ncbi:MAG: oligosaccharide flippase family protein [Flavobacterium sp.]|nr:oligosaccharide flippase family protein [Flavobacterium sp.]